MTIEMNKQRDLWEQEYAAPVMFPHVGDLTPSECVYWFYGWAEDNLGLEACRLLDVCCGKGRNGSWIAGRCASVDGFDFIGDAVEAAIARTRVQNCTWITHDASDTWPYPDETFDIVFDIFALSEMPGEQAREHYVQELYRVLKTGGIVLSETACASTGLFEFLFKRNRGPDAHTIVLPNGKLETVLSEDIISDVYKPLKVLNKKVVTYPEMRICGMVTPCDLVWAILQKGSR